MVHCHVCSAVKRPVHTSAVHASLGIPHHIRQTRSLFHRCHPYGFCSWRRFLLCRASGGCTPCHGRHHECVGGGQLQEELVSTSSVGKVINLVFANKYSGLVQALWGKNVTNSRMKMRFLRTRHRLAAYARIFEFFRK